MSNGLFLTIIVGMVLLVLLLVTGAAIVRRELKQRRTLEQSIEPVGDCRTDVAS